MQYRRARNDGHQAIFFYRFPLIAIASIIHRISGVIVFLLIPYLLWLLGTSLSSPEGFACVFAFGDQFWLRILSWIVLSALVYHLLAGIKHLLMDWGLFESMISGRAASVMVLILSAAAIIDLGVRIL